VSDWRQIQARIRKAKGSKDPGGQLAALYERTRDAMVAFELGQVHEKSGESTEAVRWYTTAAQRFRRAQWKTKAEEALTRLGAALPEATAQQEMRQPEPAMGWAAPAPEEAQLHLGEVPAEPAGVTAELPGEPAEPQPAESESAGELPRKKRRRGRRGGRGRRRKGKGPVETAAHEAPAAPARPQPHVQRSSAPSTWPARHAETAWSLARPVEPVREEAPRELAPETPRTHDLGTATVPAQLRGRAGDPALASRLALLESQLRRLLASSLHHVDEADQAPAGPGVFILSDSDLTTYYYIESCQTLRIGIGNLLRGERGRRTGGESLRTRFAENLGINETRVSKYLKDHCVVRWIQLDEAAGLLCHFAIAVLRPVLNE